MASNTPIAGLTRSKKNASENLTPSNSSHLISSASIATSENSSTSTVSNIQEILTDINLSKYIDVFEKNEIDLEVLVISKFYNLSFFYSLRPYDLIII